MLLYPLRDVVLAWLLGLALAAVPIYFLVRVLGVSWLPRLQFNTSPDLVVFGMIGIALELFWWLVAFKIAVETLRAASSGRMEAGLGEEWSEDALAARQLLLWGGLSLVGYLIWLQLGGAALLLYGLLLALVAPAIVLLLGMAGSLPVALDPRRWHTLVRLLGVDYLLLAARIATLAALVCVAEFKVFEREAPWLDVLLFRLCLLYLMFAGYHELGRVLGRHRGNLETPSEASVEVPDVDDGEEHLALRAAERYAAEGRYPKAAQQLEELALAPGASNELHLRYRDLLILAGDHAGMLRHARVYVAALLDQGKDADALALFQDCVDSDPGFELEEPRRIGQLQAVAMREQRPQVAITLGEDFVRRFPQEPDCVPNGLSAARLMDRLGRDEDARLLLVDLVRRFPRHPMRGELLAALETLEDAARRGR
jgi:tetratricopeptide (TPR) repeat protein